MSTIKVDTIATRTGSGNITLSNSLASATVTGSLSAKGGAVFNEDSGDHDFRVESNNDANILRIEAAQDNVKIGSNAGNYGILSIRTESAGAQERGLYIESAPASGTSPNNVAVFSAANANMTQPLVRIHHESPTADQLLLQATTTGSNTVKFSVDEDGDIYSAGGINLGGTGTANKLDDYEEGTFTPTLQGSGDNFNPNYTHRSGQYTKVGNRVHFDLRVQSSARTENSDQVYIGGLPFSANYSDAGNSSACFIVGNGMKSDFSKGVLYANANNTNSVLTILMSGYNVGTGTGIDNFRQHDLYASHDLRVSGSYFTTA